MDTIFYNTINITTSTETIPVKVVLDDESPITINVKKMLNFSEMNNMCQRVFATVYNDNEYSAEHLQYAWRYAVIEEYSDFVMPDDSEKAYAVCYSELWNFISNCVCKEQLTDIYDAVIEKINVFEKHLCANAHIEKVLQDIQTITQAMLNFDKLPEWLADNLDTSTEPLMRKG